MIKWYGKLNPQKTVRKKWTLFVKIGPFVVEIGASQNGTTFDFNRSRIPTLAKFSMQKYYM